jgi:hypothetical protein
VGQTSRDHPPLSGHSASYSGGYPADSPADHPNPPPSCFQVVVNLQNSLPVYFLQALRTNRRWRRSNMFFAQQAERSINSLSDHISRLAHFIRMKEVKVLPLRLACRCVAPRFIVGWASGMKRVSSSLTMDGPPKSHPK